MAENKSQAQHLASLDFDISQIIENLKQVDEQTKAYGLQAGKNFYSEFQKGVNETKSSSTTTAPKIIDDKSIESATQQIGRLNSEYGKLAKTVENYNASGKLVGGKNTFIDSSGIETVVKYNEKLETVGQTMTANYAKAEKAAQAQIQKEQALRDNFYKKNMTQIDAEIAERERQSKAFSAQIKEQMTLRVKEQNEAEDVVSQIERMIEKQKQFNTIVSQQRTSSTNKDILNQSNEYISGLEELKQQVTSTGKVTEEQKAQLGEYGNKVRELSGYYQEAGTKGESFLQKISDKAKWLGAFYVVNELRVGFIQALTTIKETEDAVVNLQRVLNDESIGKSRVTEELYDIAVEYGRTFEEVAEVSQQFVQAGNDWTDAVELTRGTMLALNTAELDVTQSTEGLIAIMAQWGLEAEDYADVIDKINITADDFAVTSEKIVAALQRSSSSAKNANISLEETIGIITALAEATGRSGENIGTALNSLIVYTSKASALETFAEIGSDAMKQVVKDYQQGAVSIYNVWEQLSKEVSNLSAQQQSMLFESADFQELAATLETELKDVYGAAGTYRQNYFIALLNDMGRAKEAVENMADAQGYSTQENEKYMESLTAYFNQFKAVMAELAVQAGDSGGVLEFLKQLTKAGIGIGELVKSLGGIVPLLTAVGSAMIVINQQKIATTFIDIGNSVKSAGESVKTFFSFVAQGQGVTGKLSNAFTALTGSVKTAVGALGVMSLALTAISMIYSAVKTAQEESRQKTIEETQANLEKTEGIEDLISQYNNLQSIQKRTLEQDEQFADVNQQIISLLGDRKKQLEGLTQGTDEYANALNNATKEILAQNRAQLELQKTTYGEEFQAQAKGGLLTSQANFTVRETQDKDIQNILNRYLQEYVQTNQLRRGGSIGTLYAPTDESVEGLQQYYTDLVLAREALNDLASTSEEAGQIVGNSEAYQKLNETINALSGSFNDYLESTVKLNANEILIRDGIPQTASEFENFKNNVIAATGANEEFNEIIENIVNDMFPYLAEAAEETGESISNSFGVSQESIDELRETISELSDSIDGFQSGFDTVISAIEEYNENGYLTVDTIQALISAGGDYISMLDITANGISLNEEATNRLLQEQQKNIDAMLQQAMTADVLETVQRYLAGTTEDVESSTVNAGNAAETAAGQVSELAIQAMNGAISMSEFNKQLKEVMGETASEIDYGGLQSELNGIINRYQDLSSVIGNLSTNQNAWSNKAATSASNAAKAQTDAIKKELEAQKEAVKDRYDAEIQALKDVQEENDRLQKQEEYYRNRQEALRDIEKAATRSGVEYREQEDEARQKLEELDREWQETVSDWSIEDKIAELEALRDAEVAAIDAQIDSLEGSVSSLGTGMVNTYSNANKTMLSNYQTEYLQAIKEETTNAYATVFDNMPELFGDALEVMLEQAKLNSMQLNNIYSVNFVNPLSSSLQKIQQQMIALQIATPNLPYLPYTNGAGYFSNQSVVNNNTRNANVFANVYNQNSANSLLTGIFRKP